MADENGHGSVSDKAEETKLEENKDSVVVGGDSEESEEEALVYDRCRDETSEDSGNNLCTCSARNINISVVYRK